MIETEQAQRQLEQQRADLDAQLRNGAPAAGLVAQWSACVDAALRNLWTAHVGDDAPACLLATGGYGRNELQPASDIDLLVLRPNDDPALADPIENFVRATYDLGYPMGPSVRTPEQCIEEARADLTVMTTLLELRPLAGDHALAADLSTRVDQAGDLWPMEAYYQGKVEEARERHRRFRHVDYDLEPNIKNSPGALRDLHVVQWVACRHYGTFDLEALHARSFLTDDELSTLLDAREFLWRVRWALQLVDPRAKDRLRFDSQRAIAELLGYEDSVELLAVEAFMHDYFRRILSLRAVSDILLQHTRETLLDAPAVSSTRLLNARFRIRDGYLETADEQVLERTPSALLEVFVLLARHPQIVGVRASTIRQIRSHLHLIDQTFRDDPRNAELFMEFLRSPHQLVSNLDRMRRYGVLGAWLPEFQLITGQMQHDLFHIYTVDAHTLQVVRNLRRFRFDSAREDYPVAWHCVHAVDRVEILYIAALYHDIAKGRGGDHSELGATDARNFCQRHGVSEDDTELVVWLVENHLIMSGTAQRRDITDPEVVLEFATFVGDINRLDHLYALTVADITATNPELWNSWRASLMRQLYNATRSMLRSGLDADVSRTEWIEDTVSRAQVRLAEKGISATEAMRLWGGQEDDYFLRQNYHDIVWQTEAIRDHGSTSGPLVRLRNASAAGRAGERETAGHTEVFLWSPNQPNLFAVSVVVLDQLLLSVQGARVFTSVGDRCFNTYFVLDDSGEPIAEDQHAQLEKEIAERLTRYLADPHEVPRPAPRLVSRAIAQFQTAPAILIDNEESSDHTALRVIANDRPGLLAAICRVFIELGVTIHSARIATLGAMIEDSFWITVDGRMLRTDDDRNRLEAGLLEFLEEQAA